MISERKILQYMELCIQIGKIFSTCGRAQYGALLVDEDNHVVGMGYNGVPKGMTHCYEGGCPRAQESAAHGSNYDTCLAIHAEANCLLHSDYSSKATKLWVNGPPCFGCAKLLVNSTVNELYIMADPRYEDWPRVREFMENCGIQVHVVGIRDAPR